MDDVTTTAANKLRDVAMKAFVLPDVGDDAFEQLHKLKVYIAMMIRIHPCKCNVGQNGLNRCRRCLILES